MSLCLVCKTPAPLSGSVSEDVLEDVQGGPVPRDGTHGNPRQMTSRLDEGLQGSSLCGRHRGP